jgi:hypothetical protein
MFMHGFNKTAAAAAAAAAQRYCHGTLKSALQAQRYMLCAPQKSENVIKVR